MEQKYIADDWVKFLSEESKIIEVYEDCSYFMDSPNITGCPKEEELSPIPLVPAILEKNGWREEKGDYINDNYHIRLCEKNNGYSAYKVVNDTIVWLRDVESVSDLQHLLFGLNINSEMEV